MKTQMSRVDSPILEIFSFTDYQFDLDRRIRAPI